MSNVLLDALHTHNLRSFPNLDPPTLLTPIVDGVTGSTTYSYKASFRSLVGETTTCDVVTVTNGNASLSSGNRIKLQIANYPAGARYVRFFKNTQSGYKLLGEVATAVGYLFDIGQAVGTDVPATTNTSGRPDFLALGYHPGEWRQRQEGMDDQGIKIMADDKIWSTIYKDGDIVSGGNPVPVDTNDWLFTDIEMYLYGRIHDIAGDTITLTGVGTEKVGVVVTSEWITPAQDGVLTAMADEGQPSEHSADGADRLVLNFVWGVDEPGQVLVKEFIDGTPKVVTLSPERTEWDRKLAETVNDVSGSFVTRNFGYQVLDHATDLTKLNLRIGGKGIAYPRGFKVQTEAERYLAFNKARDTKAVNNSGIEPFSIPGGYVIGTLSGPFNLNGKNLKLKVGSGNYHTVAFTADSLSAAQVAAAIMVDINAYPSDGTLVNCSDASSALKIQAINGKSIEIASVADDAYTLLGLSPGTVQPIGTRIYSINDACVKAVTDLNYRAEKVEAVTFDGNTHKNLLAEENVVQILGASTASADCHDGKYDYLTEIDFVKTGNYIDFSGVGGSEPASGSTIYVRYHYNRNGVKASLALCMAVDVPITKGAEDGLDNLTLTGAASITRVSTGVPVTGLSGAVSNVKEILRVNNSTGQSVTQYSLPTLSKNSGALGHDTSQLNWAAAGAQGGGELGQPVTNATYYATITFWHNLVASPDFVTGDSYDLFESIETYSGLNLRDCIDFRTGGILPIHGEDATFDYEFYLSRVDKLVVDDNADFRLITGSPAVFPPTPSDQEGVLTLGVLRVPAYTYNAGDVKFVSLEPMRITQAGIQRLSEAIDLLKYNAAQINLNNEMAQHPMEADKSGIFTDALTGFKNMDLSFSKNGVTHTAALDRYEQCLLLPAAQDQQTIAVDIDNSINIKRLGNSLILDYQPVCFLKQPLCSITVNGASDFTFSDYYGHMKLTPSVDTFIDTTQAPQLNVDFNEELTPLINALNPLLANAIDWRSWITSVAYGPLEYHSTNYGSGVAWPDTPGTTWDGGNPVTNSGSSVGGWGQRSTTTTSTRTGIRQQLIPGSIQQDLGNRVVDMSLQGMMRTKYPDNSDFVIQVDITALLPNVDHACTVNGQAVDLTYDNTPVNHSGEQGSHSYQGKTTVTSSNNGCLTATFVMPSGVLIGTASIRVFYYAEPDISTAFANFSSAGFLQTNQNTVLGMPSPEICMNSVTQTNNASVSSPDSIAGYDPLAQSFPVEGRIRYISGVGLRFATKHASLGYTVQVRDMINGSPGPNIFSTISKLPADITVSEDGSELTVFTFEHVLGFQPGRYCFVGMPDGANTGYNLWASEVGTVDLRTGARIITQASQGVLFHSPNNETYEPWTKRDLAFELYEANFQNNCQIVWQNLTGVQASVLVLKVQEFIGPGTNARWAYSLDAGSEWVPFSPGVDFDLQQITDQVKVIVDVTSLGGSYQVVDKWAGILLLYHDAHAYYVGNNETFSDPLAYPNHVTAIMDLLTDGTNGSGVRSVTPMFSQDDGETLVALKPKVGYTPTITVDPYYRYVLETPGEVSLTAASNAEPIVIEAVELEYQENAVVDISTITGNTNANGTRRLKNVTATTAELYDPDTGAAIVGNGAYTGGGVVNLAEMRQLRGFIYSETTNRAVTPKIRKIGFIPGRI